MSALRTQVRTLSQASRRAPARSSAARFQRRCVTDDSSPPAGKGPAKGQGAGAPPMYGDTFSPASVTSSSLSKQNKEPKQTPNR